MSYEDTAPAADKVLHADGSVTTMAGEVILPADQNRAEEYANRMAAADKWLKSDGSVIDMSGRIILGADEGRAREYESRAANTGVAFTWGKIGGEFNITEKSQTFLMPFSHGKETIPPNVLAFGDNQNTYILPCAIMYPGDEYINPNTHQFADTANAVLS